MQGMQPLTGKEMEYIVDSMSNEELLLKQCAAASAVTINPTIKQACESELAVHEQHLNTLMNLLKQHQQSAPQQPTMH
nr:hypothetical protein [Gorillibacterium timonense]